MYNVKSFGGTFKGLIGECCFQLAFKKSYITRFHPLTFFLKRYKQYFSTNQKIFIKENWMSFDAIQVEVKKYKTQIIIYEVKTRNVEYKDKRLITTKNCLKLYDEARKLGIKVKLAKILFYNNWNYSLEINDFKFDKQKMWLNNRNNYDKTKYSRNN